MLGAERPELASSDHVSCRDGVDIIIKRGTGIWVGETQAEQQDFSVGTASTRQSTMI